VERLVAMRPARRGRALVLLGLASLGLLAALGVLDGEMRAAGGPGIVRFEVAGSLDHAHQIMRDWGADGRRYARASLALDFVYIAAYGAFFALAIITAAGAAAKRGWRGDWTVRGAAVAVPLAAAGFDVVEDVFLLLTLGGSGGALSPRAAWVCAVSKFVSLGLTLAYLGVVSARLLVERVGLRARGDQADP
jgi:hypothetical protein